MEQAPLRSPCTILVADVISIVPLSLPQRGTLAAQKRHYGVVKCHLPQCALSHGGQQGEQTRHIQCHTLSGIYKRQRVQTLKRAANGFSPHKSSSFLILNFYIFSHMIWLIIQKSKTLSKNKIVLPKVLTYLCQRKRDGLSPHGLPANYTHGHTDTPARHAALHISTLAAPPTRQAIK